jgi:hypothetical protein
MLREVRRALGAGASQMNILACELVKPCSPAAGAKERPSPDALAVCECAPAAGVSAATGVRPAALAVCVCSPAAGESEPAMTKADAAAV